MPIHASRYTFHLIDCRPNTDGDIIWSPPAGTGGPLEPFVRGGFSPAVAR
jgi:hypothetical protein